MGAVVSCIKSVFQSIGACLMAVVHAIGSIFSAIINGIVSVFDIIIGCLTCRRGGDTDLRTNYHGNELARLKRRAWYGRHDPRHYI